MASRCAANQLLGKSLDSPSRNTYREFLYFDVQINPQRRREYPQRCVDDVVHRTMLCQVVVSRMVEGPIFRLTYEEIHERAQLCALALRRLGVKEGDRVGTLAWNTSRHLEAWQGFLLTCATCMHALQAASTLQFCMHDSPPCTPKPSLVNSIL